MRQPASLTTKADGSAIAGDRKAELAAGKSVKQILIEARKLIEKEDDWFAGEAEGGMGDAQPHQRCSRLALNTAAWNAGEHTFDDAFDAAGEALEQEMGGSIVKFNAAHTHSEVLAAFDRAIEAAS